MADQILSGGSDVSGLWTTYILRKMVPGLKAELVFADYAEPAMLPSKAGGYVARWNIPTMRKGSTTALTEGTIATKVNMITITNVEATIADYGEHFEIGDLAQETAVRESLDSYRDIVQYAGATAIDQLIINAADGTTNFLHAGESTVNGVTLTSSDQLKAKDLPVIGGFFRANDAKGWDKLSKDFMVAIHPNVETTFVTDVTTGELSWSEVNKNVPAGFEQLINNHRFVGRLNGVSVLRTTMIGTVTEDVAAYVNIALARYGVGWLGLGQTGPKAPRIIFKSPGPHSTNDPLDQIHTLGWKLRAVAQLLDSKRALVVYSAV